MNPHVSVIILAWNHKDVTVECLNSVLNLLYKPSSIIVVDNHSSDNTSDLIRSQFPSVAVVVSDENRGFSDGINQGIVYALAHGAEQLLILNNDTILPPNFLDHLVWASEQDENQNVGIFIPKICYWDDPGRIWAAGARWRKFPPLVTMIGFKSIDSPKYNHRREVELATGCAMLIRRQVLEQTGLFDPIFFMYYEDYDFCQRVRAQNYKILYVPDACLWHKVSVSAGEDSPQKWFYWAQSAALFYSRYFKHPVNVLIGVSLWILLRESFKGNLSFFPHYCRGLRVGLKQVNRQVQEVPDGVCKLSNLSSN